jgi:NAD(P)-dependent dehydrogenase (short-subunit alcohol dehydrogenase family)
VSADGHELRFAVNYLSGFLLTRMLIPRLISGAPSRVINVSSLAQSPIDFADPMIEKGFTGGRAYGQSKLAQVFFTFDLAEELKEKHVLVYALHPATYMDTKMVMRAGVEPRTTVAEGAEAVMNLVTTPGLATGQYFVGKNPGRANAQAYDANARDKLKLLSLKLTGLN